MTQIESGSWILYVKLRYFDKNTGMLAPPKGSLSQFTAERWELPCEMTQDRLNEIIDSCIRENHEAWGVKIPGDVALEINYIDTMLREDEPFH